MSGAAFSNGFEHRMWAANWCDRCLVDAPFRNGISDQGCPIILTAMLDDNKTPVEWLPGTDDLADRYHCISFRAPGSGNPDPKPKATPPGQGELLPRDQYIGRRQFATTEASAEVNA